MKKKKIAIISSAVVVLFILGISIPKILVSSSSSSSDDIKKISQGVNIPDSTAPTAEATTTPDSTDQADDTANGLLADLLKTGSSSNPATKPNNGGGTGGGTVKPTPNPSPSPSPNPNPNPGPKPNPGPTPTPKDTQAPTAPSNLKSSAVTTTSCGISWTASTDNVAVTSYDVYNGTTLVGNTTTTSYNVAGLAPLTTYSFTVKAKDAAGNVSASSAALSVTTETLSASFSLPNHAPQTLLGFNTLRDYYGSCIVKLAADSNNGLSLSSDSKTLTLPKGSYEVTMKVDGIAANNFVIALNGKVYSASRPTLVNKHTFHGTITVGDNTKLNVINDDLFGIHSIQGLSLQIKKVS